MFVVCGQVWRQGAADRAADLKVGGPCDQLSLAQLLVALGLAGLGAWHSPPGHPLITRGPGPVRLRLGGGHSWWRAPGEEPQTATALGNMTSEENTLCVFM